MKRETAFTNPLEEYADEYVNEVFTPLYLNDLFYLEQVQDYPAIYFPLVRELTEKWTIPHEYQQQVEYDIEVYCPNGEVDETS